MAHIVKRLKPLTDDPSSPSKKLVRETLTRNSVRMSCILAWVFSRARNLFRVGHSSIPSKFLVRVSCMRNLDGELWSSVMGFTEVNRYDNYIRVCGQKSRDRLQNKNDRSCCRADGSESVLITVIQSCLEARMWPKLFWNLTHEIHKSLHSPSALLLQPWVKYVNNF